MASTRALGGRFFNHAGRAHAVNGLTVTDENSLFHKGNLVDGTGRPFRANTTPATFRIDADLNMLSNGGFETVFTGGHPAAAISYLGKTVVSWNKTAGATVARNTASPRTGAGCLSVEGTTADYEHADLTVVAGETWRIGEMWGRNTSGGTAIIRARNLHTGKWLKNDGTWQTAQQDLLSNATSSYVNVGALTFVVEEAGSTYPQEMTLRFFFLAIPSASGGPALYDDCWLWPVPNFSSFHGHNISEGVVVEVVGASTATPTNVRATVSKRRPACYSAFTATPGDRYVGIRCTSADLNQGDIAGTTIAIGEWNLGQSLALSRRQNYGQRVIYLDPQQEETTEAGEERRSPLTEGGRRQVRLSFTHNSEAGFREYRDKIAGITRNGVYPLVLVPSDDNPDLVVMGRMPPEFAATLQFLEYYDGVELVVNETPHATWIV